MLPDSSPGTFLPFSYCFNFQGAQRKRSSESAAISLVSSFFQRPRRFCQQSLTIMLLSLTNCSVLKVLLSDCSFHLVTTFPNPGVLQEKYTKTSPARNSHQPAMNIRHQSHMPVKNFTLCTIPSVMVPQSVHHLHIQMLCKQPAELLLCFLAMY